MTKAENLDRTAVFGSVDISGAGLAVASASPASSARLRLTCVRLSWSGSSVSALWSSRAALLWTYKPFFGSADVRGLLPTFATDAPTLCGGGTVIFGSVELKRF